MNRRQLGRAWRRYLPVGMAVTLLASCLIPVYTYDSHLHYIPNLLIRLLDASAR